MVVEALRGSYWVQPGLPTSISGSYGRVCRIVKAILEVLGVEESMMLSKSRKRDSVFARQVVAYFLRENTQLTLRDIGLMLGDRDHTTVIHSIQTIRDQVAVDDRFRRRILEIGIRVENKLST
jgi:chromosomal replication initiation ATPase DnaA